MTCALVLLLYGATPAIPPLTCYCGLWLLPDAVGAADHVVVGRLLQLRTLDKPPDELGYEEAVLLVEASWKGAEAGDTLTVGDPFAGTDCGAGFTLGGRFLVFARLEGARLVDLGCRSSRALGFAAGALDSLGAPISGHWARD